MMTHDGKLIQNSNGMLKKSTNSAILLRENLRNLAGFHVNAMTIASDLGEQILASDK